MQSSRRPHSYHHHYEFSDEFLREYGKAIGMNADDPGTREELVSLARATMAAFDVVFTSYDEGEGQTNE